MVQTLICSVGIAHYFIEDELKAQIVRYSSGDRELDDDSLDDVVGEYRFNMFPILAICPNLMAG